MSRFPLSFLSDIWGALQTGAVAINGTGNALNNIITGNSASNIINGGVGVDTMVGGLGNDIYYVDNIGDIVTETSTLATEIDIVSSSISYVLGANLENLTLTGVTAINGTGNALNNVITGNTANNIINGGAGNDILNGGAGLDNMIGGLGNDSYYVDNVGDVVAETSTLATEIDTVNSSISYALGANVENLTLTGAVAINGTGNTLNNIITGNVAANIINGGAGIDNMIGGLGNDTYYVDNIGDIVTETSTLATEIDTVNSSISYALGANLEWLTLTGTAAINGTGNTLNNNITGNSAANIINGGAGNDILNGGAGDDSYLFSIGSGIDNITDTAGNDLIKFDTSVNKAKIALFKDSSGNLIIDYGTIKGTEKITINAWNTVNNQIEKVQLGDGQYMSNVNINKLIQDMAAYSTQKGIQITSVDTVKNDQNLMNLVSAGWHA